MGLKALYLVEGSASLENDNEHQLGLHELVSMSNLHGHDCDIGALARWIGERLAVTDGQGGVREGYI